MGADRNLRLANDKAQDVTVKKLTQESTMAAKFADLDRSLIRNRPERCPPPRNRIGEFGKLTVERVERRPATLLVAAAAVEQSGKCPVTNCR